MQYVNNEIIQMINKAFPENAHLGRFVMGDKVIYGFDKVSVASLNNLVQILVFDVKNFTFTFNEDAFFQQSPNNILPQLIGQFDSDSISKIMSEFLLRRKEFFTLKERCADISGQDLLEAIDSLKPKLEEIYENDPFNPAILEKKVEQLISANEAEMKEQEQQQEEQGNQEIEDEDKVDIVNGVLDVISAGTILAFIIAFQFTKPVLVSLVVIQLLLSIRCYFFIVILLKVLKLKFRKHGK